MANGEGEVAVRTLERQREGRGHNHSNLVFVLPASLRREIVGFSPSARLINAFDLSSIGAEY